MGWRPCVSVSRGATRVLTDAVLQVSGELKASVADALEAPLCVDAASIATHHPVHHALVDV